MNAAACQRQQQIPDGNQLFGQIVCGYQAVSHGDACLGSCKSVAKGVSKAFQRVLVDFPARNLIAAPGKKRNQDELVAASFIAVALRAVLGHRQQGVVGRGVFIGFQGVQGGFDLGILSCCKNAVACLLERLIAQGIFIDGAGVGRLQGDLHKVIACRVNCRGENILSH